MIKDRQKPAYLYKIRCLTADDRRLRLQLDELHAHFHYMRIQFCFMRDTLAHKEKKFCIFTAEYYRMTNGCHRFLFDTDYEQGTKKSVPLITVAGCAFKCVEMTMKMITALLCCPIVVAVVYIVLS